MKRNLVLAIRFNPEEYDYIDFCVESVFSSTGIKVSKAFVVTEMMKIGKEGFHKKYKIKKYDPKKREENISKFAERNGGA